MQEVLSVIMVNYRGWKHLEECLTSLSAIQQPELSLELIVIDNCSNDGKLEAFKKAFPHVKFYLNQGNTGFASGCNAGALRATGNYYLFLNSDIVANGDALRGMINVLKATPNVMLLSCAQRNNAGKTESLANLFPGPGRLTGFGRSIYRLFNKKKLVQSIKIDEALVYPDWVSGSVMLISAEDYRKIGGWCEDYWLYYEDVEICWQVKAHGGRVAISTAHSVIHNHGGATRINPETVSLTKAEVRISRHVFISRHYRGLLGVWLHTVAITSNLLEKLVPTLLSLPLFFVPKLVMYRRLYVRILGYYAEALKNRTWLSPRSPNFRSKQ